jgi:hypothetical protein
MKRTAKIAIRRKEEGGRRANNVGSLATSTQRGFS